MNLVTFNHNHWHDIVDSNQEIAIDALEQGKLLFFPNLCQNLTKAQQVLLDPKWLAPKAKNISLKPGAEKVDGAIGDSLMQKELSLLCQSYAKNALTLVQQLLPSYVKALIPGRTSFRPAAVSQRRMSPRKDDKRLHVDAFPSSPNQGKRILRVFCNINPHDEPRVWRIGEPFADVAKRFLPKIKAPFPGSATLLNALKITKSKRSHYDHYMLHIHDKMKMDETYQHNVNYQEIALPALSTWIVFTDQVSHAAMSGQFMLEQTFYLPPEAMKQSQLAPINVIKNLFPN